MMTKKNGMVRRTWENDRDDLRKQIAGRKAFKELPASK